jgi:hypothetical protein
MPPGRFDQQTQPPPDRPGTRVPTMLSALALLVALVAAGVSLVALSRTGDRVEAAPAPTPSVAPSSTDASPTSFPDATATTEPTGESTADPTDGPDPSGNYTVAYAAEPLRLQPSDRYVDLDEPSGNASSAQAELLYSGFAPEFQFRFRNVSLASITNPTASANDCVIQLRRAPIDLTFAASKGQLVCVLTSRQSADDQGIRQKVVLMKVDSVGADGALNLTLTAWNVPR